MYYMKIFVKYTVNVYYIEKKKKNYVDATKNNIS